MDSKQTALWLKDRLPMIPETAIILGTGLSDLADSVEIQFSIPYDEIPGFVNSTAPSHLGNMIMGTLNGIPILILQGRLHFYEGYTMQQVVFPVRVMAALGIKNLIVTNASGSLREELEPGAIVQIEDHINFMGTNPLIGINDEELGERFPSMNNPYDPEWLDICANIALKYDIKIQRGVYIAVSGPSLETKAECACFAAWGADLVGMSTVPEVIVARHSGMKVLGFSIVTNYSNLFHDLAHSQEEIRHHAGLAGMKLTTIIGAFIRQREAG
ncbi:MAG: purine-nucleoside phosphorylase [Candidatus Cloacimonadaceae bacterium]|nr:purine-nucleoside phosphorylase [Candidatus Cloacimonadaceae bacterium]MDP3113835.1 purine-nucleoside phosphorylase [Candidatus Cloacimonadaceae bacterium]